MSYDEELAGRIRKVMGKSPGVIEKKMFGGLAFMLDGRMCCGIIRRDLVVRLRLHSAGEAAAAPLTHVPRVEPSAMGRGGRAAPGVEVKR